MMAPGTCGRSRFPDVQSPAVSYGALCGAAATRAGGSTSDTSSHELGDLDNPTPTHPRPLSHDLRWLHARDRRAKWWSVTTSNFLSLCRPISPPTSPYGRAVFQAGRTFCGRGVNCMRTLLVGALIASLMGCCRTPPQATLERCTTKGCVQRTAANPQTDIKRVAFKTSLAPVNIKSATAP